LIRFSNHTNVAKLLKVSKHSKDRLGYNNPKKYLGLKI
jgi:hypothetical protein